MHTLLKKLTVGTVIGEGVRSFVIEKPVTEVIVLRGHPKGGRGEKESANGALRIIPTIVVEDILRGILSDQIEIDDIIRTKRDAKNLPGIFATLGLDHDSFILGYDSTIAKICEFVLNNQSQSASIERVLTTSLPKPFILLAGISGTGKTRFVREQAKAHRENLSNYCLIPVRPDWHEPSDLFGYVSRLPSPRYIVTALLCFVVSAWKDAFQSANAEAIGIKSLNEITPFWCCLDEMNLAPVEQYFADYLAVLESREWQDGRYSCLPLLKADAFKTDANVAAQLRKDLALDEVAYDGLWDYFSTVGIPLPPNLIIAGTVNMDETTHGFSRKVIDRAFTIDFGAFFPNSFSHYFSAATINKTLGFPICSAVKIDDLSAVKADSDGAKSIAFLNAMNGVLINTPFELAYRALNELLIALVCFEPTNDLALQAVWDDFLMCKVLPRIDGDEHKLKLNDSASLLTQLAALGEQYLPNIWEAKRPDLLRENLDTSPLSIDCRSKQKLAWMHQRLVANGFTSFWP